MDLVKWLICTALGGGEDPDRVMPQIYALDELLELLTLVDDEVEDALASEPGETLNTLFFTIPEGQTLEFKSCGDI